MSAKKCFGEMSARRSKPLVVGRITPSALIHEVNQQGVILERYHGLARGASIFLNLMPLVVQSLSKMFFVFPAAKQSLFCLKRDIKKTTIKNKQRGEIFMRTAAATFISILFFVLP